jgi:hypothetical protein
MIRTRATQLQAFHPGVEEDPESIVADNIHRIPLWMMLGPVM